MKSRLVRFGITTLAVAALGAAPCLAQEQPSPAPAAERPHLAGRWKFDPDKSDDARAKMREAMAGHHGSADGSAPGGGSGGGSGGGHGGGYGGGGHRPGGGGGGHMGGGMGGGHGPGGPAGGASEEKRALARAAMDDILDPGAILTITEEDPEVTITADDGRVRRLYTDGRKVKAKDGAPEQTTRWATGRLVSESRIDSGLTIRESYSIDPESNALKLTAFIQTPRSETPVIVHFVYEPAPPE